MTAIFQNDCYFPKWQRYFLNAVFVNDNAIVGHGDAIFLNDAILYFCFII